MVVVGLVLFGCGLDGDAKVGEALLDLLLDIGNLLVEQADLVFVSLFLFSEFFFQFSEAGTAD